MPAKIILTVTRGPSAGEVIEIDTPSVYIIGRGSGCDLRLIGDPKDLFLSRRHCALRVEPPLLTVRDLGSRNGTYLNGRRLGPVTSGESPGAAAETTEEVPLHDGDVLGIGLAEMHIRFMASVAEEDGLPDHATPVSWHEEEACLSCS